MRHGRALPALLLLPVLAAVVPPEVRYLSPVELAISPDGARLWVACEGADEVRVVDADTGALVRAIPVGRVPKSIALTRDGKWALAANSWSDTVSVIDAASLEVIRTLKAGYEPNAAVADREGAYVYTANRIGNDISVLEMSTGREVKRLVAGRGASYLALSPDGTRLYCTHIYPNPGRFRTPPESEITVIDTARQVVVERKRLHNSAGVFHTAFTPDGRLGLACQLRPKNLIPLAHVAHGWVIGNGLAVFRDGAVANISIDELDRYFTPPYAIAVAPDASAAYVSTSGSDSVTAIDLKRLGAYLPHADANDLSASAGYVTARIPVGRNPKGIVIAPDGTRLYVANRLDDSLSVIDTAGRRVVRTIDLGGPRALTARRRGERLFYTARFAFQGQFGCANCHLEGTLDGISWDLEPDGFGKDIVDNRSLEDLAGTAPYKWNGGNPDLETECGRRTAQFFYRSESYAPEELADLVTFLKSIPPRPNRYRLPDGQFTSAQERGKDIFERTRRKDGSPIPHQLQCGACHSGPYYTNRQLTDVGTGKPTDRSSRFDVPHLANVELTAPYLHDGSAATLEEIWTVFNPNDTHGVTNDLSKDELNDLIEYLKTL